MSPIEKARAARSSLRDSARTYQCPKCDEKVVTYVRAEVSHRCKQAGQRAGLTTFREVTA